ncbi:MAG: 3-deoxy-D-manno-octulosonate 8-phosphate phosphatase [Bacteroidetes bacterium]|nr:MAG: 3-deoxy-D-manno-octulosonate 8-phosphate phosphatase [Bacteroidota bacterium]
MSYKLKLRNISTFMFDVDGVLTNGDVTVMGDQMLRTLYAKDGYALQYAAKLGYKIFIITGGNSQDIKDRLLKLGIQEVHLRSGNKLEVYLDIVKRHQLQNEEVLYMGDDIPDIRVMNTVQVAACPQDAVAEIKSISDYHSPYNGGKGCVRDVIEQTLKVQSKWMLEEAHHW